MTDSAPPPANTIPGYNLVEPSERDARATVQRVFGAANGDARWTQACELVNARPGSVAPGDELRAVAAALGLQGGAAATLGRSIEIRILTYYQLPLTASSTPSETV
ncbi:hypothetical protein [Gemmatimonas groenlandica]|uniref:Uncharacterized protein n=1 Tax=Gemmatimonas groenlandica TaxID=2732249 RepID=A0A6M4IQW7_9BACT|nr:hypothetical protein [Gemmatimonas groenlandica]QJR36535.1 hypothetical protein HKW67_13980 [Gemmatimonas groenlandica]